MISLFVFWIIFSIISLIITEIFYHKWCRSDVENLSDFIDAKMISLIVGFFGGSFIIGMPFMFCLGEEISAIKVFGWYYGIILLIVIFFGSNWLITEHLNKPKKRKKK